MKQRDLTNYMPTLKAIIELDLVNPYPIGHPNFVWEQKCEVLRIYDYSDDPYLCDYSQGSFYADIKYHGAEFVLPKCPDKTYRLESQNALLKRVTISVKKLYFIAFLK